jgi:hypothetical protein
VNDLIMLVLFAPIVKFLITGASSLTVPFMVLVYAVLFFIVIPLAAGVVSRTLLIRSMGSEGFEKFLSVLHPVTVVALLATLVCIFAFQADNITARSFHILLIAVPILIQVYFNSSLTYGLMKWLKVPHSVAAPGALIGASNFFELAVATAIALYGPGSGAALATVVGVLVEVPVMLSVVLQPDPPLVPRRNRTGIGVTKKGCRAVPGRGRYLLAGRILLAAWWAPYLRLPPFSKRKEEIMQLMGNIFASKIHRQRGEEQYRHCFQ